MPDLCLLSVTEKVAKGGGGRGRGFMDASLATSY